MDNKKKIIYSIIISFILIIGISFAYLAVNILGLTKDTTATSKNLRVTYTESGGTNNGEIIATGIVPSNNAFATKNITIQNTGDETANFNLIWTSMKNYFLDIEELKMYLTCTSGCEDTSEYEYDIPKSGYNIFIKEFELNTSSTIVLSLSFKYLINNVKDQSMNLGKSFEGYIGVDTENSEYKDAYVHSSNLTENSSIYNTIFDVSEYKNDLDFNRVTANFTFFNNYKRNYGLSNIVSNSTVNYYMRERTIYTYENNYYNIGGRNNIYTTIVRGERSIKIYFAGAMWRPLRINEDGSIRLILAIPTSVDMQRNGFNSSMYDVLSDARKYSVSNNVNYLTSDVKSLLDDWYDTYLYQYDTYLVKNYYCHDETLFVLPETDTEEYAIIYYLDIIKNMTGDNLFYYSLDTKESIIEELDELGYLLSDNNYSLKETIIKYISDVQQINQSTVISNMYSKRSEYSYNQHYKKYSEIQRGIVSLECDNLLYEKIGLITAEEAVYAGNSFTEKTGDINTIKTDSNQYLSEYIPNIITMTPSKSNQLFVSNGLWLTTANANTDGYIYPVINLKHSISDSDEGVDLVY